MMEENNREAIVIEPGGVAFCMSTRDGINESLFTEPCNDYGFVVFYSRDAVDRFVERLKKYRDMTYGKLQGEPL